jgi:hypothetical protein
MLDAWNREEHYREERYRDLAEECRRLAETTFSIQMSNRYWRMAEAYSTLAKAAGARHTTVGRLTASIAPSEWRLAGASVRPTTAKTVIQLPLSRALSDPAESS